MRAERSPRARAARASTAEVWDGRPSRGLGRSSEDVRASSASGRARGFPAAGREGARPADYSPAGGYDDEWARTDDVPRWARAGRDELVGRTQHIPAAKPGRAWSSVPAGALGGASWAARMRRAGGVEASDGGRRTADVDARLAPNPLDDFEATVLGGGAIFPGDYGGGDYGGGGFDGGDFDANFGADTGYGVSSAARQRLHRGMSRDARRSNNAPGSPALANLPATAAQVAENLDAALYCFAQSYRAKEAREKEAEDLIAKERAEQRLQVEREVREEHALRLIDAEEAFLAIEDLRTTCDCTGRRTCRACAPQYDQAGPSYDQARLEEPRQRKIGDYGRDYGDYNAQPSPQGACLRDVSRNITCELDLTLALMQKRLGLEPGAFVAPPPPVADEAAADRLALERREASEREFEVRMQLQEAEAAHAADVLRALDAAGEAPDARGCGETLELETQKQIDDFLDPRRDALLLRESTARDTLEGLDEDGETQGPAVAAYALDPRPFASGEGYRRGDDARRSTDVRRPSGSREEMTPRERHIADFILGSQSEAFRCDTPSAPGAAPGEARYGAIPSDARFHLAQTQRRRDAEATRAVSDASLTARDRLAASQALRAKVTKGMLQQTR
ncbi:hypothetical protein M885DRAFT_539339 [Pelagophyceae sp. CCMP2097]|nr:hypothetical protein M885DRAFT_539339 [Pelagophyceae sp. CCMP2097]